MKFLFTSGNIAPRLLRFALPVLGAEKNEKVADIVGSSLVFVATGSSSRKIRYSCVILLLYQRFE